MGHHRKGHWRKRIVTAALFVAAGLLVSALHTALKHSGYASESYGLTILDHLSVALFAAPVLGAIIELPHMADYFRGLIELTIMKKEYLKDLTDEALDEMKQKCLEAFFHLERLDRGFYTDFYKEKLEKQVGSPYRTDTIATTTITADADGKTLNVVDEINFVCQAVAKSILQEVRWTTDKDEIRAVVDLKFTLTRPKGGPTDYSYLPPKLIQPSGVTEHLKLHEPGHGCTLKLMDYKGCDGLRVNIKVNYKVARGRAFSWTMPCLSKGFNCTIKFPTEVDIFVDSFGMDSLPGMKDVVTKDGMKVYCVNYTKWLLPHDGFAFSFSRFVESDDDSAS